jgi:hypothetical protein
MTTVTFRLTRPAEPSSASRPPPEWSVVDKAGQPEGAEAGGISRLVRVLHRPQLPLAALLQRINDLPVRLLRPRGISRLVLHPHPVLRRLQLLLAALLQRINDGPLRLLCPRGIKRLLHPRPVLHRLQLLLAALLQRFNARPLRLLRPREMPCVLFSLAPFLIRFLLLISFVFDFAVFLYFSRFFMHCALLHGLTAGFGGCYESYCSELPI